MKTIKNIFYKMCSAIAALYVQTLQDNYSNNQLVIDRLEQIIESYNFGEINGYIYLRMVLNLYH